MADGRAGGRADDARQIVRASAAVLRKTRNTIGIAGVAVIVGALALIFFLPRTLVIDELWEPRDYRLSSGTNDEEVHGFEVTGHGEFAGSVTIELIERTWNPKTSTGTESISEKVTLENGGSFEWGGDWYSAEAIIRVTPGSARDGKIKLRYRFNTLP
jgi:hypothetical protein